MQVYCINNFVEDGIEYWSEGNYYDVEYYDGELRALCVKHNYGQGLIYDEDFDEYFKEVKGE